MQFQIQDADTGNTLVIEADKAPTQQDAAEIFSSQSKPAPASTGIQMAPEADRVAFAKEYRSRKLEQTQKALQGPIPQAGELISAAYDELTKSLTPKSTPQESALENMRQMALAQEVSPQSAQEEMSATVPQATPVGRGVFSAVDETARFFTSPLGVATLGMSALPKALQETVALGFAAQMASQTPAIATELGTELGKPESERDYEKIAKLTTTAVINTGFTAAAGAHVLAPETLAPRTVEAVKSTEKGVENASPITSANGVAGNPPPGNIEKVAEGIAAQNEEPTKAQEVQKEVNPEWQVTVQAPEKLSDAVTVPGYVQIDDVTGGQNKWSKSPETLRKEGVEVPDYSQLPQGKYTVAQANELLKGGEPIETKTQGQEKGVLNPVPEPSRAEKVESASPTEAVPGLSERFGMGAATPAEFAAKGDRPQITELTDAIKELAAKEPQKAAVKEAFSMGKSAEILKDGVSDAVSGLKSAGQYLKQKLIGKPVWTDYKSALGNRHLELTESALNAKDFVKSAEKSIPNKTTQEAISNWIDAGADNEVLKRGAAETKPRYKAGYEEAKNLTPAQKNIALNVQDYFKTRLQDAIDAGILEDGIEDYIHRTYESESPWKSGVLAELRSGVFTGKPALAKQRVFQYDFEAEKAGLKPIKSFIKRVAAYDMSLNKAIADRNLVKAMTKIKMPDGRPMVDVAGSGIAVPKQGVTEATLIKPDAKVIDPDNPKDNRGDYKAYDYPALRRWKWATNDSEGNPIFVKGDVLIHPDAIKDVRALFERSAVRANPVGRAALGVSNTIKQTMLDLSGFHPTQITVHGWEHRTFKPVDKIDLQNPDVRGLIKGGQTAGDTRGYELFSEGLTGSSLTKHLPVVGEKLQAYNQWLFNDYIPRLKMATGLHALERNKARYPNLTPEEQYHLTANEMNAAFGELNYDMLGRSKTTQDLLRLGLLAPDFLEARGRFVAQAGTKYGKEQFSALALGAATLYITARIINKLLTGEYHMERKNAFSVVYNNKAYSLRTVQGDLLHAFTEPGRFVYNRLNPVFGRTGLEFITGRDAFGRKRDLVEQAKDFAQTPIPISLRGVVNPREQNLFESFLNSIGVTERRSTSMDTVRQLAEDWKKENKVRTDPGEFIYDPDKDPYRNIRQAALFSSPETVAKEIQKAVKAGDKTLAQIRDHFHRSAQAAFTGSAANDAKFAKTLSEDNKKIFMDAKAEKRELLKKFNEGYKIYLNTKK